MSGAGTHERNPRLDRLTLSLLERRHLIGEGVGVSFAPHRFGAIAAGLATTLGDSVLFIAGKGAVDLAQAREKRPPFGRQRLKLSGGGRLLHHRGLTRISDDRSGLTVETVDLVALGGDQAVDPFRRGR